MKKHFLAAAFLSVITLPVCASNLYVVADVGQIKYEGGSDSETTTGFTLGGGYKINDTFAIEVAYRDLGEIEEREYEDNGGGNYYQGNFNNEFSALQISLVAGFAVSESINLYGRLGYADIDLDHSYSIEETTSITDENGTLTFTTSSEGSTTISKNKVFYGIGASYSLSELLTVRAEYGLYDNFNHIDISSATIGLTYLF